MKILVERCLEQNDLDRNYEAKNLLLEELSKCLHHGRAANEALVFAKPGLKHVDEPDFEANDIVCLNEEVYVFRRKRDRDILEFTTLLGKSKPFAAECVQPRRIFRFKDLT